MIKIRNVYFDTNVFDHIYKRTSISESDLLALDSAVKTGKISVLPSITNFEEVVCVLVSRPNLAIAELRLILRLTDIQNLLKPHFLLVSDDIKSYALTGLPSQPFIDDSVIQSILRILQNPSQQDMAELLPVVKATQEQKQGLYSGMEETREKILLEAKKLEGRRPSFNDYWKEFAKKRAESFAERVGVLDACKKRGINGLLELRSVRLALGMNLSLFYAQTLERRTPKIGDSRDIHHAIIASAADGFVTDDGEFARLLSRVLIEDFEVMNLNDLFELIR